MKTTNKLIYNTSKVIGNEKIDVTIRLDENCKNGYEYFSATCSGYERLDNNRWNDSFGGCSHDEIIRFFPELEIFIKVHLWSFGGYGLHSIANGLYFLNNGFNKCTLDSDNFEEYYCNYFSCTMEQYNTIKVAESKEEFAMLCIESGIIEGWKKTVSKAIKELEKLTGLKFKSTYAVDKNEIVISDEKITEIKKLRSEGYYTVANKNKREKQRIKDLKKASLLKIREDYYKAIQKHKNEWELKKEWLRLGLEIQTSGNMKGGIYHNHTNTLEVNWSTEKLTPKQIDRLVSKINKVKFSGLKITNNDKLIKTI